jgi:hypothetical protein
MKKQTISILVPIVVFMLAPCTLEPAFANSLKPDQYYTWGISNNDVVISQGSIITEAVLTIHNITNNADNENDALYIHLLDNLPLGFVSNSDYGTGDFFENQGMLLAPVYHDRAAGVENLVYTLGNLNDESSWVWDIFGPDFGFELADGTSIAYSSAVLELIDYAGNGTPFGFGFDPNSTDPYNFDEITLELTIESFNGSPEPYNLTFIPFLIVPIGDKSVDEKKTLTFEVIATSPYGDALEYSAINLPDGATFSDNIFTWRPWYGAAGSYYVTFLVTDGYYEDSQTIAITVNAAKLASWYERWYKHLRLL